MYLGNNGYMGDYLSHLHPLSVSCTKLWLWGFDKTLTPYRYEMFLH